jgi:hypothetical protein
MKPIKQPPRFTFLLGAALSLLLGLFAPAAKGAVTILQSSGGTAMAWEAENHGAYVNDPLMATTPSPAEIWAPTNDATASGGKVLYALGQNVTAFPASYVDYQLQFATPGSYRLYIRAKADAVWASADRFTANSIWIPLRFSTPFTTNTPDSEAHYVRSAMNASDAQATPSSTNFQIYAEVPIFEVTQADVDNRVVKLLRVGTRERGVMLDRLVLSTDQALTESGFNVIPNSDVDIFVQPASATHIAFEAENPKGSFQNDPLMATTPSPAEIWSPTNDATASGGKVLYALGQNVTAFPASYVDYRLQFTTPGSYRLYIRAKADAVWASADRFTANSIWIPLRFNTPFTTNTPDSEAHYVRSAMNASDAQATPSSTNFQIYAEAPIFEVTQAMVDGAEVITLRVGTRERGVMLDRLVLSTDQALSETGFNSLPNTELDNIAPKVVGVSPSITFTNVVIIFDEAISPGSIDTFNFAISGGLTLEGVPVLDAATLRRLTLHTSPQTPGTSYTITFSGVADVSGNAVPDNSTVTFESWRLQAGWVARDLYSSIPGGSVGDLVASPKYPNSPDSMDSAAGVSMVNNPRANNYGMRIRFFFTPAATDMYDFYVYADDQAEVFLSTDDTAANLVSVVNSGSATSGYDPAVKGSIPFHDFVAGQRYLVQVLYKQGAGEGRLGVAIAPVSAGGTELPALTQLVGDLISTYINPGAASVTITRQPQSASVTVGNSAGFDASATSPAGSVVYQWQVNGVNIPGANRPSYITPSLSLGDSGKRYRVVASAGGATATSAEASVTVNPGQPPSAAPYVGINFLGGGGAIEGFLSATDIAGAIPQGNFNNVEGGSQTAAPLNDASGNPSPVTVSYAASIRYTGAGNLTAENALFEGYIQNNNAPMTITLGGVPPGSYGLLVYSVGFDFQTIYDQAYELVGSATYPVFRVRAQTFGQYRAAPGYRRMSSTDPGNRDSGNYVMFEGVSPDANGIFTLNMTPEPPATPGVGDAMPAVNAIQLVRLLPALTIVLNANGTVTVSWDSLAAGFTLQSTGQLGGSWNNVGGVANPITAAGSTTLTPTGAQFYRLRK